MKSLSLIGHRFSETADLYATILHELTHWTGHKSRLNRESKGGIGIEDYAFSSLLLSWVLRF